MTVMKTPITALPEIIIALGFLFLLVCLGLVFVVVALGRLRTEVRFGLFWGLIALTISPFEDDDEAQT